VLRRVGGLILAIGLAVLSGWAALAGAVWGFALQCDDSCSSPALHWRDDPDAWQWSALGWAGIALFALPLALLVLVVARRRAAARVYAVWAVTGSAFLALLFGSDLA
jgi:hypothetical protein